MRRVACAAAVILATAASNASAQSSSLETDFSTIVQPFVQRFCAGCHGKDKPEARLDLSGYTTVEAVAKDHRTWKLALERLENGEMPPDDAPQQPTAAERKAVVAWIRMLRADAARRHAGDPGIVLARRLSNFEFDCTVRDLTGVDLRPTREFPVDPANEAGFDNSGESLTMSPALLKKYLAAARSVADHLVLKPDGFAFAPHAMISDTDRDKYCVARIVDFYQRHRVDYADYLFLCWQFNHQDPAAPTVSLADLANHAGLSPRYAETIWAALTSRREASGPLAELQSRWQKLPAEIDGARHGCEELRDFVIETRKQYITNIEKLKVKGISDGSQPLVLWRNRQLAARRMRYDGDAAIDRFCRVFPGAFFLTERPPYFEANANSGTRGRLLTAGFHLMQGYFRDDGPLCELVLSDEEKREVDDLWQELNFITDAPARQYKDFIFFERAEPPRFAIGSEFDFARSEDKDATSAGKIERLRGQYLKKAGEIGANDEALAVIEQYFAEISADIRWVEQARFAAEPSHLAALVQFAQRAYRRPLSESQRDDLVGFYHRLRQQEGSSHEDAMRDCLASVLLSPEFCYRYDLAQPGETVRPLTDHELASRLSYFLWSSMPDGELLNCAATGKLHDPDVLVAQTRRMLRDRRVRGLAVQFAGNLFDFRRFDEHNSVDRERFATFTNELRQAMYEEPIRFFVALAAEDRAVLDLLYGDYTYVNALLAAHYGMPAGKPDADGWWRVDHAAQYGRGGLLPMAVFLTKNSPGLRTSPVKRGYWVVRRLLGERIPSPPPEVPELPKDEAQLGELTLPQLLAQHREQKSCAACHERFDSFGLAFEGYDPIGGRRERDLAGHPVQNVATFRDGSTGTGLDGLRDYLRENRQQDFVENFSRKLLTYALGRALLPSDDLLIENMRNKLAANEYRFGTLVETIVTSPQFLNKRGAELPSE